MSKTAVILNLTQYLGDIICQMPMLDYCHSITDDEIVVYSKTEKSRMLIDLGLADECRVGKKVKPAQLSDASINRIINARPRSISSSLSCRISGNETVGFKTISNTILLNKTIKREPDIYRPYEYLKLAGAGSDYDLSMLITKMANKCNPAYYRKEQYTHTDKYILIIPRFRHVDKFWGYENLTEIAQSLLSDYKGFRILIHAGPDELLQAERLVNNIGTGAEILAKPDLMELSRISLNASVALIFDSGPAHIPIMSGIPVVGVFDNHTDKAEQVMRAYFDFRPGASAVLSVHGKHISSYPVDIIRNQLEIALHQPHHEPKLVFVD